MMPIAGDDTVADRGTFSCAECGFTLAIEHQDELPGCPVCGSSKYLPASLFLFDSRPTQTELETTFDAAETWLEDTRLKLDPSDGSQLAFNDGDAVVLVPLSGGMVRIGRSPIAEVRLDDPTVSRRHAWIDVNEGKLQIYDDRSLNGVFVNGHCVEDAPLNDGDVVTIGRFHLHVLVPVAARDQLLS